MKTKYRHLPAGRATGKSIQEQMELAHVLQSLTRQACDSPDGKKVLVVNNGDKRVTVTIEVTDN